MTDKQKAIAAGAVILGVAALFLLFRSGANPNTVVASNSSGLEGPGNVTLQNLVFNRQPFTIPPLNVGAPWERLSAIGACCADCSGSSPRQNYAPAASRGPTIVFNEGARGANVYNYFAAQPVAPVKRSTWGYKTITARAG